MLGDIFRNKRVLITGHTGFKGSWLAVWLHLLGAKVTGFALPPEHEEDHFVLLDLPKHINHVEGDIRDANGVRQVMEESQPEFVFHLAAQSLVRRSYANPKLTIDTNVGGTVNVLEAVRAVPSVHALVYVSSEKCYRNREWVWSYRENDELGGDRDPYSVSKACAELIFASYRASFLDGRGRLSAASVRASNVIGGGDWAEGRILPDCFRALRAHEPISLRHPQATRPWQHVLEPLGGYLLLARRLYSDAGRQYGAAWNFGPGKDASRTVLELVNSVIEEWGEGKVVISQHEDDRELPEVDVLHVNCDKAYYHLHWRPVWGFLQAVQYTTAWYRAWIHDSNAWKLTTAQIESYMEAWQQEKVNRPGFDGDSDH